MGQCSYLSTKEFAVTANLDVNYRNRMPLGTTAKVEAWVVKREGRKIYIASKITSLPEAGEGFECCNDAKPGKTTTFVEATALFVAKK